MKIEELKLNIENFSNGGKAILASVSPNFIYEDGVRTEKVAGAKVMVAFPNNGYKTQTVKAPNNNPADLLAAFNAAEAAAKPLYVELVGFKASFYNRKTPAGTWVKEITASAENISIIGDDFDDDFDDIIIN